MKRTIIGAAALAAAGLFGSLPYDGMSVAQQGAPTVHRDVALVDNTTTLLNAEDLYLTTLNTDLVSSTGLEHVLYTALGSNANAFLDTTSYLGDFDGALTADYEGYLADTVALEDGLNGLLGVSDPATQATLLADFYTNGGTVPVGDAAPVVGADFDSDLYAIATTDYQNATTDFANYSEYLINNFSTLSTEGFGLTTIGTIVTDLSSELQTLSTSLSTDATSLLGDIGSFL